MGKIVGLKLFAPPPSRQGKTCHVPSPVLCLPPPLPVINDQSLTFQDTRGREINIYYFEDHGYVGLLKRIKIARDPPNN